MNANLAPAYNRGQWDRLSAPFEVLAATAPAEFPQWQAIAHRGAEAASRNDRNGVRTACGDCHDTYRAAYRSRMRTRSILASHSREQP